MPELPEVETSLHGIQPYVQGQHIKDVIVRHYGLRWPIPANICQLLTGKKINQLYRRAKYLLFNIDAGTAIVHLGMSGSLRILTQQQPAAKHDHFDIILTNNTTLRFTDPRRFGAFLWTDQDPNQHPLLKNLGLEPLDKNFSGKYLWSCARNRTTPIKSFIMNNKIVVGVGNIYATESLFLAKIYPARHAKTLSYKQCGQLVKAIKTILQKAIKQGGTTLKDFVNSAGKPGYFSQYLNVYGRALFPCINCNTLLKSKRIGQRSTVYCKKCQR